ncbi:hypothetical protein V5E97_04725 [Singulisphaera sp. Ch08]|uniref:Uncharacterized protein n=1 Tax=Singulisphaera sp. Ch08 TaxID=3120278 RepID=A0AAU7CK65_9BACT
MAATRQEIQAWLERGKTEGATHVIVICDTYGHDDYPVYVSSDENAREKANRYDGTNMQRIMEVYNLSMDMEQQLSQHRVLNY